MFATICLIDKYLKPQNISPIPCIVFELLLAKNRLCGGIHPPRANRVKDWPSCFCLENPEKENAPILSSASKRNCTDRTRQIKNMETSNWKWNSFNGDGRGVANLTILKFNPRVQHATNIRSRITTRASAED